MVRLPSPRAGTLVAVVLGLALLGAAAAASVPAFEPTILRGDAPAASSSEAEESQVVPVDPHEVMMVVHHIIHGEHTAHHPS